MTAPEWTVSTLKEHLDELRQADQRAVNAALAAAKEAVAIAETNAERWRASANEWRGAMNDRERNFISRQEVRGYLIAAIALIGSIAVALLR